MLIVLFVNLISLLIKRENVSKGITTVSKSMMLPKTNAKSASLVSISMKTINAGKYLMKY